MPLPRAPTPQWAAALGATLVKRDRPHPPSFLPSRRPCPIGLSVARVVSVEGRVLTLAGACPSACLI